MTSIKGLGEAAIHQIVENRPFASIEEFLFNENIVHSKLNKKAIDVLVRSQSLTPLMDDRFSGMKHFWSAVAVDEPKNLKKFIENIELYKPEDDFADEEKIEYLVSFDWCLSDVSHHERKDSPTTRGAGVPPIGEYDTDLGVAWFVPRESYPEEDEERQGVLIVKVTDSTSTLIQLNVRVSILTVI